MTSTQADSSRARVGLALATAVILMLGARFGYGLLEARYTQAFHSVPIPRGSLDSLPLEMGDWRGHDEPIKESLIEVTDTDDHVSRSYQSPVNGEIGLWIGYGGRLRDLVPHRPEICYPSNGYRLDSVTEIELKAVDGKPLPCRIMHFSRGDLQQEHIAVLNYYLVDGEYSPDVSLLREKASRLDGSNARYVAQIQIVSSFSNWSQTPDAPVQAFAVASAHEIRRAIQSAVDRAVQAGNSEEGS